MTEAAEEIEIALDDSVTKPDEGALEAKTTETPKASLVEPEEGIEVLKRQVEEAKTEAESERQARIEAQGVAAKASKEAQDTNVQLVTNAIEGLKQAQSDQKRRYSEAMSAQDFDMAADIQVEMAEAASRKLTLENGLEQLKAAPPPQSAPVNDPVEALARQLTPKSATWIRAHPEYARNPRLNQRLIAAHNLAVTSDEIGEGGIDTPEYFAYVERSLGLGHRDDAPAEEALSGASQAVGSRTPPPAAPPSRGNGPPGNPRSVRLTPEQVEMAEMMGLTKEEYARNMMALKAEGRLN